MSSSVVIERTEDPKDDDTLVIIVNADGTLSVDPKTLQKVIASQQNASVSLLQCVDNGQPSTEEENENGLKVNLVVEGYFPPNNIPSSPPSTTSLPTSVANLAIGSGDDNPFLEMDPEELARLETALHSEEAKQILGENVAAMLDDLNVSEKVVKEPSSIHSSIQFDHCYTSMYPPKQTVTLNENRQAQTGQAVKGKGRLKEQFVSSLGNEQQLTDFISKPQQGAKLIPVIKPLQMSSVRSNVPLQNTYIVAQKKGTKSINNLQKVMMKQVAASATQVAAVSSTGEGQNILSPSKQPLTGVSSSQPMTSVASVIQSSESHSVIKNLAINQKVGNRKLVRIIPDTKKLGSKVFTKLTPGQELNAHNLSFSLLTPLKSPQGSSKQIFEGEVKNNKLKWVKQGGKVKNPDDKTPVGVDDKQKKLTKDTKDTPLKKILPKKSDSMDGVAFVSSSGGPVDVKINVETKPVSSSKKQPPKTPTIPLVVGPALFSAPDIIRRINSDQNVTRPDDKDSLDNTEAMMAKLHDSNYDSEVGVLPDGTDILHQLQDIHEDSPIVDSSTGPCIQANIDLNNIPIVIASSPQQMISTPSPLSPKVSTPKIQTLKQTTLVNHLKILPSKISDKVSSTKTSQLSSEPSVQQGQLESPAAEVRSPEINEEKLQPIVNQGILDSSQPRKLPPIELPATRGASKRLIAKNESFAEKLLAQKNDSAELDSDLKSNITPKKANTSRKQEKRKSNESKKSIINKSVTNENADGEDSNALGEKDDQPSEDDQSWNSEDDPDRLWCICKKPHNNRFMICCDTCEEWFHGKCVGITKAMGEQMEEKGIEWVCPQCKKKRTQDLKPKEVKKTPEPIETKKIAAKRKSPPEVTSTNSGEPPPKSVKPLIPEPPVLSPKLCIVCTKKDSFDGVYCSDECIEIHVKEFFEMLEKKEKGASTKQDTRVIVMERNTGRVYSGSNAPTIASLKMWLLMHPSFEIIKPTVHPSSKYYSNPKLSKLPTIPKLTPKTPKDLPVTSTCVVSSNSSPVTAGTHASTTAVTSVTPAASSVQVSSSLPSPVSTSTPTPVPTPVPTSARQVIMVRQASRPVAGVPMIPAKPQVVPPPKNQKQPSAPPTTPKTATTPVSSKTPVTTTASAKVSVTTPISTKAVSKSPGIASTPKTQPTAVSTPSSSKTPLRRQNSKDAKSSELKDKTVAKPVKKVEVKKTDASASKRQAEESPATTPKTADSEPVRKNVRKMLQDALSSRVQECSDLQLSNEEISKLAESIEEELYNFFKEAGPKYKTKSRSLVFNIKDPKNLTLFRKIADKSFSPQQVARLSPEEMASQELAQWRERENKHQLDMIKKNELDLLASSKTFVLKTHKGEQEIENEGNRKDISPMDFVPELNQEETVVEPKISIKLPSLKSEGSKKNGEKQKEAVKEKHSSSNSSKSSKKHESSKHSSSSSSNRHRRSKRRHKTDRDRDKKSSDKKKDNKSHSSHESSSQSKKKSDDKSHDLKKSKSDDSKKESNKVVESEVKLVPDKKSTLEDDLVKQIKLDQEKMFDRPLISTTPTKDFDSDISDREPSSTVIINTPPYEEEPPPIWKGLLSMTDVAKFFATFQAVSGNCSNLGEDIPDAIDCVGRINPATVWDYIAKVKRSGTKEIIVIRFTPENDEERVAYLSLYAYLSNKNRMAVVGNLPATIKDFYVLPLADHSPIPQVLLPLDGPGFEDVRPHLLLGIVVKHKSEVQLSWEASKINKKEVRSYTPPPLVVNPSSLTPPYPPPQEVSLTPPKKAKYEDSDISPVLNDFVEDDDSPYSPGDEEPYSPGDCEDEPESTSSTTTAIQKEIEEMNKKIEEQKKQLESISSAFRVQDPLPLTSTNDELYSPSGSVSPPKNPTISFYSPSAKSISLPPNLQEILESIKKPASNQTTSKYTAAGTSMDLTSDPIVKAYSTCPTIPDEKIDDKQGIEEVFMNNSSEEDYDSNDEESSDVNTAVDTPKLSRDPRQRRNMQPQITDEEIIKKIVGVGYSGEPVTEAIASGMEDPMGTQSVAPPMMDMSVPPPMMPPAYAPSFPPYSAFPPAPPFPPQTPFLPPSSITMAPMAPLPTMVPPAPMIPPGAPLPFPVPAPPTLSNPSEPPSTSSTESRSHKSKYERASDNRQEREYRTRNKSNSSNNSKNSSASSSYSSYRKDDHSSYQNSSRSYDKTRDRYRDRFRPHNPFWRGGSNRGGKSHYIHSRARDEYDADIKHFEKEQRERSEHLRKLEERRKKNL